MNREEAAIPSDPLAWDERLESGVLAIDLQHRVLFQLLQRVGAADGQAPSTRLDEVLAQLRAYADYHFRYEEDWMRRHPGDGPAHEWHEHLHAGFVDSLADMTTRLQQGKLTVAELGEFLRRWLIGHIVEQDLPLLRAAQRRRAWQA